MKAIEQYFLVVLFTILYKVVLTFESVDEILKCDHSNDSLLSSSFLWCCFSMLYKVGLTFEPVGEIPSCNCHLNESYWTDLLYCSR